MAHVATVTIDNTQVDSDLTDFVVYVDLSDLPTTEFWGTVANGGGDIRCYKSDGTTQLAREVVSCDTATDTGELHIKFSGTLSSSVDTEIQIWTDEGTEPAASSTYGSEAVWSDYAAVYHGDDLVDSTSNGNDLTLEGGNAGDASSGNAGKLGDAFEFGTSAGNYRVSSFAGLSSDPLTMQGWVNPNSDTGNGQTYVHLEDTGTVNMARFAYQDNAAGNPLRGSTSVLGVGTRVADSASDPGLSWWLAHLTVNASYQPSTYLNGSLESSDTAATAVLTGLDGLTLGARGAEAGSRSQYCVGLLDEVRIFSGVLSADWIATEYANQNSPSTFYTAAAASTGTDVSPFGLQALHRSYQPVAASRLNGVMQ
jgi:hypothetical protein